MHSTLVAILTPALACSVPVFALPPADDAPVQVVPVDAGSRAGPEAKAGPATGFAGVWVTDGQELLFEVDGDRVAGLLSSDPPVQVIGKVSGRRMRMGAVVAGQIRAQADLLLAEDGRSFSGRWIVPEGASGSPAEKEAEFTGVRPGSLGFAGSWSSTFGRMRLEVSGSKVTGTYELAGPCAIEGTVDGRLLRFRYAEPGGVSGSGEFRLAEDGASFTGRWRQDGMGVGPLGSDDEPWFGLRAGSNAADEGTQWLVILEPQWERSLRDSEYSFGAMLREYYRRIPGLRVRHRRIHDRADFERVGNELSSINGTVILYVASHGTEAGAALADGPIDAPMISRLLAQVKNVQLVHFGSCLVASGKVPEDVLRSLPPERRVPISGFTRTADWGGSAIVDFAYLDNLIERGLDPKAAVAATRRNILFASESAPGPVPPMDLRILMPEDVTDAPGPGAAPAASR